MREISLLAEKRLAAQGHFSMESVSNILEFCLFEFSHVAGYSFSNVSAYIAVTFVRQTFLIHYPSSTDAFCFETTKIQFCQCNRCTVTHASGSRTFLRTSHALPVLQQVVVFVWVSFLDKW
jgi:hypothetical protein